MPDSGVNDTQAEMVFEYYHIHPKTLTLSQRADLDPHLGTGHGEMAIPPEGKPSGSKIQGR